MAMNKKEQQAFAEMQQQVALAKALRWTEPVQPDVMPPTGNELRKGFLFNSYIGGPRVDKACTSAVHHAFGQNDKTTTQQARCLYSTRLLALKALRHELELKCAAILLGIDQQIDKENHH